MKENKIKPLSKHQSKRNNSSFFFNGKKDENLFFPKSNSRPPFFQSVKKTEINSTGEQEKDIITKSESPTEKDIITKINKKNESGGTCAVVSPNESQTVNNPAGDNSCTPSFPKINWDIISKDDSNWGVCVSDLILEGNININPWPNKPNTMTVPNTPNPKDGGNINNTAGSDNHWKAAIDDMKDYDTAGGGAGPNWHSVDASIAHENAHWNIDWIKDSILDSGAGDWNKANKKINELTEPKSSSATKADAKSKLAPKVDSKRISFGNKAVSKYNSIPDTPGDAKGAGYKAGAKVLSGLIASVKNYKNKKGW